MLKNPTEYGALANELWQRGLTVWFPESEIFQHNGIPVVSGFFGVGKGKEVPGHPGLQQLRLICNLVPSNGYFREIMGGRRPRSIHDAVGEHHFGRRGGPPSVPGGHDLCLLFFQAAKVMVQVFRGGVADPAGSA